MYIIPSLTSEIIFERKCAIIYDIKEQQVYLINEKNKLNILKEALSGVKYQDLLINNKSNIDFIQDLLNLNLIMFTTFNKRPYKDNWNYGSIYARYLSNVNKSYHLKELSIEITNNCDLCCSHCGDKREYQCKKCFVRKDDEYNANMHYDKSNILKKIISSGCRIVRIIGGNPLMELIEVCKLKKYTSDIKNNTTFVIVTNGLILLDNYEMISTIYNNNIALEIQVVNEDGNYDLLFEQLTKFKVAYSTTYYIDKENQKLKKSAFLNRKLVDITENEEQLVDVKNLINIAIFDEDVEGKYKNLCINRKLHIAYDGGCYICPAFDTQSLGNIFNMEYSLIFSNAEKIWGNISLNPEKCQKCDARAHCHSCIKSKLEINKSSSACNLEDIYIV